jgi:hypothetical protein
VRLEFWIWGMRRFLKKRRIANFDCSVFEFRVSGQIGFSFLLASLTLFGFQ